MTHTQDVRNVSVDTDGGDATLGPLPSEPSPEELQVRSATWGPFDRTPSKTPEGPGLLMP